MMPGAVKPVKEMSYNDERKMKRLSNMRTASVVLRSGFGIGYFTLQEVVGDSGFVLSIVAVIFTVSFIGYGIWRTCGLANRVEEFYDG